MEADTFRHYRDLAEQSPTASGTHVKELTRQLAARNEQLDEGLIRRSVTRAAVPGRGDAREGAGPAQASGWAASPGLVLAASTYGMLPILLLDFRKGPGPSLVAA
jgi:hypothetical protein